ncbi:hypothetical protein COCMIDRAFT_111337 [Bipolaris oryzae ATCC 44560]|uniref:Uncharacterized protein n=1 Tax=Bipolaris oryzae ATCC 44560 TaxID=930090 RepID=W6YPS2_COCMI|nr:uncharacterized protein COCMIDRAFT_111337 [Bipolaris oryzae ATCC 44560]EUC39523.1 hypothetical protein COCMIDRAFT_111337 [Bipolaris oryzae ATCC 44560]
MNFFILSATIIATVSALTVDLALSSCPNAAAFNITQTIDGDDILPLPVDAGPVCGIQVISASPNTSFSAVECALILGEDDYPIDQVASASSPYCYK